MSTLSLTRRRKVVILGLLSLAACAEPTPPPTPAAQSLPPVSPAALNLAPATSAALSPATPRLTDKLPREKVVPLTQAGKTEPVKVRLYESSLLPFFTYYPADMVVEELPGAEPARVRFSAPAGGEPTPRAFLEIVVLPPDQDESPLLRELKKTYPNVRISTPRGGFVIREYRYGSAGAAPVSGRLLVSVYDGRYFVLRQEAPLDGLEGLGSRVGSMQREWIWSDSGRRLLGG